MSQVAQRVIVRLHQSPDLVDFKNLGSTASSESFVMSSWGSCSSRSAMKDLLKFRPTEDGVEISPTRHATGTSHTSTPWIVVQDLPVAANRIVEGDSILLGRATVDVKRIVSDASEAAPLPEALFGESICWCEEQLDESLQCRICLMSGASEADPFVQPCDCRGSIEHVHLSCLRRWTQTRLRLPEGPVHSLVLRRPSCELCQAEYPTFVARGAETEELFSLPAVQAPYLVLESGVRSKGQPKERAFHVVSFAAGDLVKIGRGSESHVRLDEPSLSRWHASLHHANGEFLLEDNQSKYGTLLALRRPWMLDADQPVSIKLGRRVFSFALSGASETGSPSHTSNSDAMSSPSQGPWDQLDLDMHPHHRKYGFDSIRGDDGEEDALEIQYQ